METTPSKGTKTNVVTYTPFSKNENVAFGAYYYMTLRRIVVGGKRVRVPRRLLEIDVGDDGGFIVDSGSTFTFMERPIYDMVAREFRRQVNYTRAAEVEACSGLGPYFVVPFSGGGGTMSFPEMGLSMFIVPTPHRCVNYLRWWVIDMSCRSGGGSNGLWPYCMYREFVSVEGEGRCSKLTVEVSVPHVNCTEDVATFVALAATVDRRRGYKRGCLQALLSAVEEGTLPPMDQREKRGKKPTGGLNSKKKT